MYLFSLTFENIQVTMDHAWGDKLRSKRVDNFSKKRIKEGERRVESD